MARKFYSSIVARATAFWYCKLLSVLCLYDMGCITQRETISRIARIMSMREKTIAQSGRSFLSSWADWQYLWEKVREAYKRRQFVGLDKNRIRKCMRTTVMVRREKS